MQKKTTEFLFWISFSPWLEDALLSFIRFVSCGNASVAFYSLTMAYIFSSVSGTLVRSGPLWTSFLCPAGSVVSLITPSILSLQTADWSNWNLSTGSPLYVILKLRSTTFTSSFSRSGTQISDFPDLQLQPVKCLDNETWHHDHSRNW